MSKETTTVDIANLFGKPEDNPNFNPDMPFDTGFKVVGHPIASVLGPDCKETGYFVSKVYKQLIDSKGRLIGVFNGTTLPFLLDLEGNRTNYFLSGSICPTIMYVPKKSSQKQ